MAFIELSIHKFNLGTTIHISSKKFVRGIQPSKLLKTGITGTVTKTANKRETIHRTQLKV